MIEPHAEQAEFDLEGDPALAALFGGEDCSIEFLTDVKLLRVA
jgi:hypothetical protein